MLTNYIFVFVFSTLYLEGKFPLLLSIRGSSSVSLPQWGCSNLFSSRIELQSLPDSFSVPGKIKITITMKTTMIATHSIIIISHTLTFKFCLENLINNKGMIDSILNIGMNDEIADHLVREIGPRFAYDTYARFLMNFGIIVMAEDPTKYYNILNVI